MRAILKSNKPLSFVIASSKSSDHLHQQAFSHSFQASIIFNVADDNIISVNRSACKLFGYTKKDMLTKNIRDLFKTDDKRYQQLILQRRKHGSARADQAIIKKNGKSVLCAITSVEFKNDDHKLNSIMTIVDLSNRILQENMDVQNQKIAADTLAGVQHRSAMRQSESNDWIRSVNKTSYDLIWDWDIPSDLICFGKGYEQIFGYKLPSHKLLFTEWMTLFEPEQRAMIKREINTLFASAKKSWKAVYQFNIPDGTPTQIISRANILRNTDGQVVRVIGVIHDQSRLQNLTRAHEHDILLREKQLAEAIIEAKEMERSELGKELHDNVNQLLGASVLYLDMARSDPSRADIYLSHSEEYTKNAISEIRQLTKGLLCDLLQDFGLLAAITQLTNDIMETLPVKIHCLFDAALETDMSEAFKLNIFRIVQEQLNNILKHARANEVHLTLSSTERGLMMSIADDGKGFDTTQRSKGVGMSNITSRARLYKGEGHFLSEPGKGCILVVNFPPASWRAIT
ncbi:MAG: PAS domain-containing protein [Chitinophagaceae bacterium]|nr:PAS domain-containing protein [Chitinophagaceae bacterium]